MRRFTVQASSDLSLERLGDYVDGVHAALAERAPLAGLAPPWEALLQRCDAAEARQKKARRALNRARVGYWIRDADFDQAVRNLSSETYHLAGKDDAAEPYVSIFGAVRAEDIIEYGEEKATSFGRNTGKKAEAILAVTEPEAARTAVKGMLDDLGRETAALAAAGDQREDAGTAVTALDIERRQLIRDTLTLIADTEVGILSIYKGRRDLVDRVLALDFNAERRKKKGGNDSGGGDAGGGTT
ncbi:MAG: hypothetical protein U1F43_36460 [Myxococcota bacterium]